MSVDRFAASLTAEAKSSMNRVPQESQNDNSAEDTKGDGMGLAPVFAAALGAACCLGIPLLVGLFGGGTSAALSGGSGLLSLFIIGFALGGVLVVALRYMRTRRASDESSQAGSRRDGESESVQ